MFKRTDVSMALAMVCGVAVVPAWGQQQPAPAEQASSQPKLERVEITGSSIKRIEGETALPVQVLTRQDIQKSGAANVEQLMQTVSAMSSSGGLTSSSSASGTTGGISAVSLRGLTSIRTLVLLNGRRIAPYGIGFTGDSVSVDVNSIPLAAVDRVEVLKEGASAVYGSDAIAGVVNFILRKDFKGLEMAAEAGQASLPGGSTQRVTATWGHGDLTADRFNVMVVGSYQKEAPLFGRDRDFSSTGINEAALNDTTSGNTFPANISIPALDANDSPPPARVAGTRNPSAPFGCSAPLSQIDPFFGPNQCRFDPSPIVTLIPDAERSSVFSSARLALTQDLEGYAEASYNKNTQRTIIQPVPLSDQFSIPPNHPLFNVAPFNGFATFLLRPSSQYYPSAFVSDQYTAQGLAVPNPLPDVLVRYRSGVTGNRDITDVSESPRFTLGLRGTQSGWDFDTAALYTRSKVKEIVNSGYPLYSKILPLLDSGNVNPFGPSDPAVEDQIRASGFTGDAYQTDTSLTSIAAKASREVAQLPGGAMSVAFGLEAREERYLFDADPALQTGDVSGYGGNFLRTDKTRKVAAAFTELVLPITKTLEADGAVRFDKYQGVGSSTTPKAGLRWQPSRELMLRGSIGKGFRAPSLQDLFLPVTTSVTPPGLSDPLRCPTTHDSNDCSTQFPVTFGGTPTLKPEKSVNKSIGMVLEPTSRLSMTVDYFEIRLTDTISNGFPAASILQQLSTYGNLVTRGPDPDPTDNLPGPIINIDQTNLNFGETRVTGADVDVRFRIPDETYGRFTLGISGTYFTQFDTENPDGTFTGQVDQVNTSTGGVTPRWKHRLTLDWLNGPWNVTVAENFQKHYNDIPGTLEDPTDPSFSARIVGNYETFDVQGAYSGIKQLSLAFGVKNIFGSRPPYTNAGGQTSFQSGYDPQYADPRGRFFYGRVAYQFD